MTRSRSSIIFPPRIFRSGKKGRNFNFQIPRRDRGEEKRSHRKNFIQHGYRREPGATTTKGKDYSIALALFTLPPRKTNCRTIGAKNFAVAIFLSGLTRLKIMHDVAINVSRVRRSTSFEKKRPFQDKPRLLRRLGNNLLIL